MSFIFFRRKRNARIFFKIEECENLTRRNTVRISRTKVTAGEAEVAAHNLSMTNSYDRRSIEKPEKETFGFFDKIGENNHSRTGTN